MISPDRKIPGIARTTLGQQVEKVMQPPAVLNLELAQQVARVVPELPRNSDSIALDNAYRLSIYNFALFNPKPSPQQQRQFLTSLKHLDQEETWASAPHNPLPPIGWEVENNTKAFYHLRTIDPNRANYQYKAFFHALGIPNVLNLIENDVGKDMTVEIASYPAYSARVASRLLSEYIKCGIIPSLRSSSDPGDIKKYLSDKLVSFHINLGVPLDFDSSEARRQKAEPQAAVLASSLSLGFSSPLRLRNKSSSFLSTWKYGQYEMVETSKTSLAKGRLELKALEVRDTSVYRLIAHSQLLGAAFFASFGTHIPHLAAEWRRFEDSINTLYNEFNIKPQQLSQKRQLSKALNMRKSPTDVLQALDIPSSRLPQFDSMNIQPFVRILLDDAARRIRKVIYRPSKTPLQTTKS